MGFVDRPQAVWWRKLLFEIHLWSGVVLGLYAVAISLSGSVLVFEREFLDDTSQPSFTAPARKSFGELVVAAEQAHPGIPFVAIDNRNVNGNVVTVILESDEKTRLVNVDANSGHIVDASVREQRHRVTSFLERLHNQLLGGRRAEIVNGVGGALMFLMALTGIVLWWPGRKHWKRATKVLWSARWPRLTWDLHSAFGFWTLLLVAMWGLTGLYFIFPQQFSRAVRAFVSTAEPPRASDWKPGQPVLSTNEFVDKAMRLYPDTQLVWYGNRVYEDHGFVAVYLSHDRLRPLTLEEEVVYMHPATGSVLGTIDSSRWSVGDKLLMWSYTIHFGDFAGWYSKVLWAILGLVPAGLTVTGYLMWWNRVLKKKFR
jgi:uncharacterized iron-regulated membrane protein